jgi:hypothetical protein
VEQPFGRLDAHDGAEQAAHDGLAASTATRRPSGPPTRTLNATRA